MKANLGISDTSREGTVEILNRLLADEYILYTKTRNYHWNVTGPQFNELHGFFEKQYESLDEIVDEVAERVRTLDGWALGSVAEFTKYATVKEHPGQYPDATVMLANLVIDHEAVIRRLRTDIETVVNKLRDSGTADFLTTTMARHEKMAWMLRAHVEERPVTGGSSPSFVGRPRADLVDERSLESSARGYVKRAGD